MTPEPAFAGYRQNSTPLLPVNTLPLLRRLFAGDRQKSPAFAGLKTATGKNVLNILNHLRRFCRFFRLCRRFGDTHMRGRVRACACARAA
jgi:hypothetical protein